MNEAIIQELQKAVAEDDWSVPLWKTICAFQDCLFMTSGRGSRPGIQFKYSISAPGGRGGQHYNGESVDGFGNEMWIITDGGQKKKSISRSTVERAMSTALELMRTEGCVKGPKALNVPGAHSYLYPIFLRFGVIRSRA